MIVTLESNRDPLGVYIDVALLDDGAVVVEYMDLQGNTEFDDAFSWASKCTTTELPPIPQGWRLRTA